MMPRRALLVISLATLTVLSMAAGSALGRPLGIVPMGPSSSSAAAAVGHPAASLASRLALENQILATAKADHIPTPALSLPNLLGQPRISDGVVSPLTTVAPAPMGIGDIGVRNTTGTPQAYTLRSSSWEGSITIYNVNTFMLDNDGALSTTGANNTFGVQLNTVTNDTTVKGQSGYSFWTQNVMYWNLVPGTVTFLDNIWNFSSPAISLEPGTIAAGNGSASNFYFAFGPTVPVTLPVTIHLFLNTSITNLSGIGYSTVRFAFDVVNAATQLTEAAGTYDTVLFNSTLPSASVPFSPFLVDGANLTPTDFLLYDSEIMIGGPGGGTTTSIYGINATEQLQYWNRTAGAYENAPSAWNVGTDTGETSEGISETYTTPGTVSVGAGPSIPTPFWNATPGGNVGRATISGPLNPSNAFVFVTPGNAFNVNTAAWAPTQTASSFSYAVPPGTYRVSGMLSDYAPVQATVTLGNGGHASVILNLKHDSSTGVYTPLVAWNNGQLAAISTGGDGSTSHPYLLENGMPHGGLNSVFGESNDFFYPVFPGLLLAGTTAHVDANNPALWNVTYPSAYDAALTARGLPLTNNLQFELYEASNVSIWNAKGISGWFYFSDFGPTGFVPLANVIVWGGQHDLIGHSLFVSQGSSLLLAGLGPTGSNVIWGNTFVNSAVLSPTMWPGSGEFDGPPIGIFAFEGGDLIYNNAVETAITAYDQNANEFFGTFQPDLENWNLSAIEPSGYTVVYNGYTLSGTIVHSKDQGGNFWADYVPGVTPLPYNEFGFIGTPFGFPAQGDYFPLPIA